MLLIQLYVVLDSLVISKFICRYCLAMSLASLSYIYTEFMFRTFINSPDGVITFYKPKLYFDICDPRAFLFELLTLIFYRVFSLQFNGLKI